MDRISILATLRAHQAELQQSGVDRLFLFGSIARDQGGADSDVDLFFESDNPRFSLIDVINVQEQVAEILHTPVDIMTRASLHPRLRQSIEAEALRVF